MAACRQAYLTRLVTSGEFEIEYPWTQKQDQHMNKSPFHMYFCYKLRLVFRSSEFGEAL